MKDYNANQGRTGGGNNDIIKDNDVMSMKDHMHSGIGGLLGSAAENGVLMKNKIDNGQNWEKDNVSSKLNATEGSLLKGEDFS